MGSMSILAILILLVVVLAAAWALRRRARRGGADDEADRLDTVAAWPPTATRVLGSSEIQAYKVLVRALPDYMVLAKIPLARFVKVPRRHSYAEWLRRLGYQCADFVVCDMASSVVAVVNVHRAGGETNERAVRRDKRIARVLKAAGIPLLDWAEDALPDVERAREWVLSRVQRAAPPVAPAASTTARDQPDTVPAEPDAAPREPPPSTWFDDFNSAPAPLKPAGTNSPAPTR